MAGIEQLERYGPVRAGQRRGIVGGRPARKHEALKHLFLALTCVPADEGLARRAGRTASVSDAVTPSKCRVRRAELCTRNRKDYPMKEIVFFDKFAGSSR